MTARNWLIVGHGSVGSAMAQRIDSAGDRVLVYDPAPRVVVKVGRRLDRLGRDDGPVDLVLSCVPPSVAEQVPALIAPVVRAASVLLDWNTVSPEAKQAIASASPCEVLDVALLDTLDADGARPRVAISGARAADHQSLLESLGFHVDIAGSAPGDAALLKYARSIFMKSLEGLALEYMALTEPIDRHGIVAASVENNLGRQAMDFLALLVSTNRRHASRRAGELADAVAVFEARGASIAVGKAVVPLLERAAQVWQRPDAPAEDASLDELIVYLEKHL
jgi:3-hydroxyisobutyrate dehydrogenase-like beta-hydroxyacid dehydrogenase